jgi:hypothetical protein
VAQIDKPGSFAGSAKNVSELLDHINTWHVTQKISASDVHRRVWYRGHGDHSYVLWPGVYRPDFTATAASMYGKSGEDKRLNLEREMLSEFRTSGATHLDANNVVEVYFTAQHFGMPTRLLDWTMNPLTALFFAVKSRNEAKDGEVVVMDAPKLLPDLPDTPKSIVTMRHPYAVDAIGLSFGTTRRSRGDRP